MWRLCVCAIVVIDVLAASGAVLQTPPPRGSAAAKTDSRRIALAIGNDSYGQTPLRNAVNDARAVALALERYGFRVDLAINTTFKELSQRIDRFASDVRAGDVTLIYYAGHGIQVDGENYLLPVDFNAQDEADVKYESYAASRVIDRLSGTAARLNIVVLDACRNNPFRSTRAGTRGLAPMDTGRGSLIAFATAPNRTADDNPSGKNGLFTSHLLEAMDQPGLTVEQVFSRTRQKVNDASGGRQIPWTVSSVIGDFYFRAGPAPPPAATTDTAGAPRTPAEPKAAVIQVLSAYRDAYETMDVDALRRVYPGFGDFKALQQRFADLRAVAVAMNPAAADITIASDGTAKAACVYSMAFTSRTNKVENTRAMRAVFQLRSTGGVWIIERIDYQ